MTVVAADLHDTDAAAEDFFRRGDEDTVENAREMPDPTLVSQDFFSDAALERRRRYARWVGVYVLCMGVASAAALVMRVPRSAVSSAEPASVPTMRASSPEPSAALLLPTMPSSTPIATVASAKPAPPWAPAAPRIAARPGPHRRIAEPQVVPTIGTALATATLASARAPYRPPTARFED